MCYFITALSFSLCCHGSIIIGAPTILALAAQNAWSNKQEKWRCQQQQYSKSGKYPNNLLNKHAWGNKQK